MFMSHTLTLLAADPPGGMGGPSNASVVHPDALHRRRLPGRRVSRDCERSNLVTVRRTSSAASISDGRPVQRGEPGSKGLSESARRRQEEQDRGTAALEDLRIGV